MDDDNDFDDVELEGDTLSLAFRDCPSIPDELARKFATQTKALNLTECGFYPVGGNLDLFPALDTLIADKNDLPSLEGFPAMSSLRTLWFNNNHVEDLPTFLDAVLERYPNVTTLSLMRNPCVPDMLLADPEELEQYRNYVIHRIPKLTFLDSGSVEVAERRASKALGQFTISRAVDSESQGDDTDLDNDVPDSDALSVGSGTSQGSRRSVLGYDDVRQGVEYSVQWVEDDEVDKCMCCSGEFGLLRRKHHCRSCGSVVCSSCSDHRCQVPGLQGEQRVCNNCWENINEPTVGGGLSPASLGHAAAAQVARSTNGVTLDFGNSNGESLAGSGKPNPYEAYDNDGGLNGIPSALDDNYITRITEVSSVQSEMSARRMSSSGGGSGGGSDFGSGSTRISTGAATAAAPAAAGSNSSTGGVLAVAEVSVSVAGASSSAGGAHSGAVAAGTVAARGSNSAAGTVAAPTLANTFDPHGNPTTTVMKKPTPQGKVMECCVLQ